MFSGTFDVTSKLLAVLSQNSRAADSHPTDYQIVTGQASKMSHIPNPFRFPAEIKPEYAGQRS
ncbi:hypothetical protein FOXB_10779 [Fusarium oxysporum f. sp. conglutinans Fo5176]|uniref:Uncharacterized protein n=1 Tax=Fusarium oxysporum (strain Fo5176) TaxID=660025 RepID=F9FWJ7_FUSOF|nr:hypothetical protein FOXB_10779 [Fusarium oxysporum f. sp. conglutinans Fo5176]